MKFKKPEYLKGKPIEEWLKEPEVTPITPNIIQPSSTISQGDYWKIENVNYRGKIENVRLWKQLIPSMNYDSLVKYSIQAKSKGEFYSPNIMLNFAIFDALHNSKDSNEKEEARTFIQESLKKYPTNLTGFIYNPKNQLDEIIHNYKMPNEQFSYNDNIVGPDREIISADKNVLEKILGTNDIEKIKKVFKWINNTPTWIWRVNSKPTNKDERVARLYANSGWVVVDCDRIPSDGYPSFGIVYLGRIFNYAR